MPFSQEKYEEIQRGIRHALVSTSLNDWERKFLRDMKTKLDRHGPKTTLSDKQYRQLMKLASGYAEPKQRNPWQQRPGQNLRVLKRRGRKRLSRTSSILALALAAIALGFVLVHKGAERFPEYLGPMVTVIGAEEIIGPVTHVRDGDTIEVSGVPIRFGSLDCAERGTRDGQRATARMRALVEGQKLTCHLNGRTSYDRKIGSCQLQDGRDLGAIMIREGYCQRFW